VVQEGGSLHHPPDARALLPEREVSSPSLLHRRRRRQNGPFGRAKKPWQIKKSKTRGCILPGFMANLQKEIHHFPEVMENLYEVKYGQVGL